VVSTIGCTVLGHIPCVEKLDVAMLGMVMGGVHSHLAIIGFKIALHSTTYQDTRYCVVRPKKPACNTSDYIDKKNNNAIFAYT